MNSSDMFDSQCPQIQMEMAIRMYMLVTASREQGMEEEERHEWRVGEGVRRKGRSGRRGNVKEQGRRREGGQ